jgi:hypothetical protein
MNELAIKIVAVLSALLLFAQASLGASAKTYQVTGPIVELTDKVIVVQKGDERWEIARNPDTRVKGQLKVGQKVTVHYRMSAASVETKSSGSTSEPGESKK